MELYYVPKELITAEYREYFAETMHVFYYGNCNDVCCAECLA